MDMEVVGVYDVEGEEGGDGTLRALVSLEFFTQDS